MALQKFTAPLPEYIPHIDHDPPADVSITVGQINSNVSITGHASWTQYYTIYLSWTACDPSHYPAIVSYSLKTVDGSEVSDPSAPIVVGTTPKYEVYFRSTKSATPGLVVGDAGRWGYITTTTEPYLPHRIYDIIGNVGISGVQDYVQFCVTGPTINQEDHLIYDVGGDMTGLYTGTGTDYGPGGNWQIKSEDSHVIGITVPVAKGFV